MRYMQRFGGRFTVPGYEHLVFNAQIVEIEPERRLSMRWRLLARADDEQHVDAG